MDFWTKVEKRRRSDEDEDEDDVATKRQRTQTLEPESETASSETAAELEEAYERVNADDFGRNGLRRSIALALQHVGFDSASQEALESYTTTVETYLGGFIEQIKDAAEASRRARPTPMDFATVVRKHNVPLSFLKPHLKNPVAKEKLEPAVYDPLPITRETDYFRTPSTEFLGKDLDGQAEKQAKFWIPSSLPPFPSKHTYKFTHMEAPKRARQKRDEAAADARKGETALRKIDRAAKIRKQKELNELAQRNAASRRRYGHWEAMMKELIPRGSGSNGTAQEIADHSVIVDYTAPYVRKDARTSNRAPLDALPSKG